MMGNDASSSSSGGVGVLGLIQVALVVFKIIEFEGNPVPVWSWWTVLIPTWIGLGLVGVVLAVIAIVASVALLKGK